jgi:hypothetical protein
MLRLLLLITGVVWASLLLISWSGPLDASSAQHKTSQESS